MNQHPHTASAKPFDLLKRLVGLSRPFQLSKSAAVVLWGQFCGLGNHFPSLPLLTVPIGIVFLTAGLYSMNDIADLDRDRTSSIKRYRGLASNRISITAGKMWMIGSLVCGLSTLAINSEFGLFVGLLLVFNGWVYSFPPARLKERPLLDVLSGAIFSNLGRYLIGHYSVSWALPPLFPILVIVLLKISTYLAYRKAGQILGSDDSYGTHRLLPKEVPLIVFFLSIATIAFYFGQTGLSKNGWLVVLAAIVISITAQLVFYRNTGALHDALRTLVFSARSAQGE